ncbi:hybrid sensor histidine kinase/response regulator [Halorussus halophilus]|uniref:hybrid sensor histidine kinase/response regulator n=1 Tax=Halorussus halophilus TaxID=2650975 RepID=UPI0013010A7A|nr:response regulator [Halorussus halophilus]
MEQIRVLLVDDQSVAADLAASYLERVEESISTVTEDSAEAGLSRLADESFDCVVSDYDMPDSNGLEFLDSVRELEPRLPFILFTGKGSEEIASEAISAGVTDYLQKETGTEQYEVLANRVENAVSQHRAEVEAEEANEQMRRTYRRITDAFYALDDDWQITYVNEQAEDFFDRPHEELVGKNLREAFPKTVGEDFYDAYSRALETQEPITFKTESVFQPGRWVEERVFPSEDGLSVYFRDVTERRRREQTLSALHEVTRELMQAETDREIADVVCRVSDTVLDFPGTSVRLYDEEEDALVNVALGGKIAEHVDSLPSLPVGDHPHGRAFREGETVTYDVKEDDPYNYDPLQRAMYVPMGDHGVLSVGKSEDEPFDDANVQFAEILTENARAAFDRAERERELRERERDLERQNERLEEFASVVSHDLRNPLNVARGHLELARETDREESYEKVESAHDRMAALIDDLLTLAREGQSVGETEEVALEPVAERAWENVATSDATLDVQDLGSVEADEARLCNLFENLFRNSVEHASTSSQTQSAENVEGGASADVVERDAVMVTIDSFDSGFAVADDGPGIPEDVRERVLDFGYSTADDGTGLGLAIVREIAAAHGWELSIEESETGGARFEFSTK